MKMFAVLSLLPLLMASTVSLQEIVVDNLTTITTSSTVDQSNSSQQSNYLDLSQPLLPALVDSYFLQPLANLNAQISQTAGGIPNQFAQNGQSLGNALMVPIQAGAASANGAVTQLNSTLISLSTGAVALLQPVVSVPIALISQANSAVSGLTLNALNYSTSLIGEGINNFGESVSNAGQNVQQMGGNIMKWAQSIEQMRQELNNSTNITSTAPLNTTTNF